MRIIPIIAAALLVGCGEESPKQQNPQPVAQETGKPSPETTEGGAPEAPKPTVPEAPQVPAQAPDAQAPEAVATASEKAEPAPTAEESIAEFCQGELKTIVQKTVSELIQIAGTEDCETALTKLSTSRKLNLKGREIYSSKPLSFLTSLEVLDLSETPITDLTGLSSLNRLQFLNLSSTKVVDGSSLDSIESLVTLALVDADRFDIATVPSRVKHLYLTAGLPVASQSVIADKPVEAGTCKTGNWFVDEFASCRHESHGVELYKNQRSPACGIESSENIYKSCRHRNNGWDVVKRSDTYRWPTNLINPNQNQLNKACYDGTFVHFAPQRHKAKTSDDYDFMILSAHGEVARSSIEYRPRKPSVDGFPGRLELLGEAYNHVSEVKCRVTRQESNARIAPTPACGVVRQVHTYNVCRHHSHGPELYNMKQSSKCGTKGEVYYSDKNTDDFELSSAMFCADCSQIQATDPSSAKNKLECFNQVAKADNVNANLIAGPAFEDFLTNQSGWLDLEYAQKGFELSAF